MPAPRDYRHELRERAQRLVAEAKSEDPSLSLNAAVKRIGPRVGILPDTLRGWLHHAGDEAGTTTTDAKPIKDLEAEVRELKRANEILLAASPFFARELCATRRDVDREVVRDEATSVGPSQGPDEAGGSLSDIYSRRTDTDVASDVVPRRPRRLDCISDDVPNRGGHTDARAPTTAGHRQRRQPCGRSHRPTPGGAPDHSHNSANLNRYL